MAARSGHPYDLVLLDIMMPGIDGQEALRQIRGWEEEQGISLGRGTKIIMTTCLDDPRNVLGAFQRGCESYLVKPIDREKLMGEIRKLGLIA